jgi:hypothetical protein
VSILTDLPPVVRTQPYIEEGPVKTRYKVLAALVSVAILGLAWNFVAFHRDETRRCHRITITGPVSTETFVKLRDCLVRSVEPKKTVVFEQAGGGDGITALALGILIHRHNWDVEVADICASSCANFMFPAGKTKYLHQNALLLFHGGPYQENMTEFVKSIDQGVKTDGAQVDSVTLGQVDKEGTLTVTSHRTKADQAVRDFLSIPDLATAGEILNLIRRASDQFYQELGVNPLLPTYGQIGGYEATYKSYKYYGFVYGLDSLRRLGVGNIELKEGEWHPERHPRYTDAYEVTFP